MTVKKCPEQNFPAYNVFLRMVLSETVFSLSPNLSKSRITQQKELPCYGRCVLGDGLPSVLSAFGGNPHFLRAFQWLGAGKRHINIWHINNFSVTPVTDPPGRVPGRKCSCGLGSAHSTYTLDPWPPSRETPPPTRAVTGNFCLCLCAFSFPEHWFCRAFLKGGGP